MESNMSFGTLDAYAIIMMLEATQIATRDQALKLREIKRLELRLFEDMHGLPHSFQTKAEADSELRARGLHGATVKEGHHNR